MKRRRREETERPQGQEIMTALERLLFSSHSTARAGCDMTATTDATTKSKIVCRRHDRAESSPKPAWGGGV